MPAPINTSRLLEAIDDWAAALGLGDKALLTTHETARVLRISERHVRQQIKAGAIPCIRFGRRVLIPVPRLLQSLLADQTSEE